MSEDKLWASTEQGRSGREWEEWPLHTVFNSTLLIVQGDTSAKPPVGIKTKVPF